jgi:hypothetical protein
MIIAMTISMSGGRWDDRPWPGIGIPFEVPDEEGEGLIRWHHAVKIADSPEPVKEHVTAPAPVSLPAETAAGPVPEALPAVEETPPVVKAAPDHEWYSPPDAVADEEPDPESPAAVQDEVPAVAEPPKPADPKQAWIDYAVVQGLDADAASAMTKADLMSRFGGRL